MFTLTVVGSSGNDNNQFLGQHFMIKMIPCFCWYYWFMKAFHTSQINYFVYIFFVLVVVMVLISIPFNGFMVVFAHIYTSFIDSRGTDPSVVYLRSHHVIQDFFLLLPENLSTLRYLIKIFGWFDTSFWTVLLFLYINDFFRPFSFSVPIIEIIIERPVLLILSFFVRSSLCHFVILSLSHFVTLSHL